MPLRAAKWWPTVSKALGRKPTRPNPSVRESPEQPPTVDWLLCQRGTPWIPDCKETPLACLYRMYEATVLDDNIYLRNEIEYFFNHAKWKVCDIQDPKDPDPIRYAILAVLPEFLVIAFNRLIEKGLPREAPSIISNDTWDDLAAQPNVLETVPDWAQAVPPLKEMFIILDEKGHTPADKIRSKQFLEKNIICVQPHILFV